MKTLDLYIARAILVGASLALAVLVALDVFFGLVGELEDIGRGAFGYRDAFFYILLTLPARIYELFPAAVLVGSLLSLGALASQSELVAMRAAGVSVARIVRSAAQAGLLLLLAVALIGEFGVPPAQRLAQAVESKKKGVQISSALGRGVWVRQGRHYINIGHVYPGMRLEDVRIYEIDAGGRLLSDIHAASVLYDEGDWELREVKETRFAQMRPSPAFTPVQRRPELFDARLFSTLSIEADMMSARSLHRYIHYLDENGLDASNYRLAFWLKIMTPVSCVVMLFIVLPFVFGSLRSVGAGQLLVIGILLGLGFYILIQIASRAGQIYGIPPFISATFPVLVFTVIGLLGLTKVR